VSAEVTARIVEAIADRGPIGFDEFMDLALYGPGGFFERPPVGTEGHFVTSPHVHPVFARLVGAGLEILHGMLERPDPFRIVEVGAGDGAMARELIDGFARAGVRIDYVAVEVSPGARAALGGLPIGVRGQLEEVGGIEPGVVLANELLDDLPFRRVRRGSAGLVEVRVGSSRGRFVEVEVAVSGEPELEALAADLAPGGEAVIPVRALGFVDEVASALARGFALLIDYGSEAGPGGPVHGYRDHRVVADVLSDPGSSDITAGVDLRAVARRASERGLVAFQSVPQWAALTALGYQGWARDELERQGQLLSTGRGAEAVRTWEGRSRASLLVDPGGLGGLRWLVLATPGLGEPVWLREARAIDPGLP
jgi:SAM-dependent MidA family methyltransferase